MTAITINDINPRLQYTATALQTTFVYNFPVYSSADLLVYRTETGNTPDDDDDLQTVTTHYTVTGVGTAAGGTVVFNSGLPVGTMITIMRGESLSRTAQFPASSAMSSETVDVQFNHLLLMIQQLNAKIERVSVKYDNCGIVSQTKDKILPVLAASQTWRMNTAGTSIEGVNVDESGSADILRADLAQATVPADGARLIGYNDGTSGATTVHAELSRIDNTFVGMMLPYMGTTAPFGWILIHDDVTLGDASSGANHASGLYDTLYLFIWNNISDTYCPVSGGRGGSAAADWAAHKTILIPRVSGRAIIGAGNGSGLTGRTLGSFAGTETHSLTSAENGTHTHAITDPQHGHAFTLVGTTNDGGGGQIESASGALTGITGLTINTSATGILINNSGSGTAHENMMPWIALNYIIKY